MSDTGGSKRVRHSGLELLRILAACFVIVLHYNHPNGGGAFRYAASMPLQYHMLLFCEMLGICAVNLFVMLSGYFRCTSRQVKLGKILALYLDVIVLAVIQYLLKCLLGEAALKAGALVRCLIPLNWYVAVYTGLYLISPWLNGIIRTQSREQFRFMLLVFFFVLSLWPSGVELLSKALDFSPNSLSPISNQGSGDGYTLVHFILMYFLGAYGRLHGGRSFSRRKGALAVLVYLGCAVVNTVYAHFFLGRATSYCNPLVVIQAVALFMVFRNLSIRSKKIDAIAGCAFGVYLTHQFFFRFCQIPRFATGNPFLIPVHVALSAVLIYAAGGLLYGGYRKLFGPLRAYIQKKLDAFGYET